MQAAVLLDLDSHQVLLDQGGDRELRPSGLVKLMTVYLLFQAESQGLLKKEQKIPVSAEAWHAAGSRMFIQPGLPVTAGQLAKGLLIDGGNDAAVAVAQAVAGSVGAFVDLMNRKAAELGLSGTHFSNPDGLPGPGQQSTALEIARLAQILVLKYPQVLGIAGGTSYTYNGITQYNYNPLAGRAGINGLGVGRASAHRWNLALSSSRKGRTLIAVILGARSRAAAGRDGSILLHYGFHAWRDRQVYPAGAAVAEPERTDWNPEKLQVLTSRAVTVSVPYPGTGEVQEQFRIKRDLRAPVRKGQTVGNLCLRWKGQLLRTVPVIAGNRVAPAGWFTRFWQELRQRKSLL